MEEKIVCPICRSEKNKFFCEKNKYKLYECQDCNLAFVYPIPKNLSDIYNKDYFKDESGDSDFGYSDYDKDKEPMKENFISYIKKIEKLVEGRKIFDIGSATGYFLDLAKSRGWETFGSEISRYAADIGKSRGHNIFCGQLPDIKIDNKFDVITMWDVLEHLDNPHKYLYIANKILDEDGLLVINTINRKSIWARILGKRWHLLIPPEHLFYYSPKSLNILLKENGFKIEEMRSVGKNFSLSYIFSILYHWQRFKIWNSLSIFFDKPFWRKFSIPINLRDNIFIIAKKIKNA